MDINSYSDSDSDEDSKLPQPSAEETGAAHTDDERDAQQTRAPAAAQRNKHLNLQQRVPGLGAPVGGEEQVPTQIADASLAGPSIGGAGGPVPEFVLRLLAEELKEQALAQGELLGNDVRQPDYTRRLETLARLPRGNSPSNANKRAAPPPKLPPSLSKQPRLATSSLQGEAPMVTNDERPVGRLYALGHVVLVQPKKIQVKKRGRTLATMSDLHQRVVLKPLRANLNMEEDHHVLGNRVTNNITHNVWTTDNEPAREWVDKKTGRPKTNVTNLSWEERTRTWRVMVIVDAATRKRKSWYRKEWHAAVRLREEVQNTAGPAPDPKSIVKTPQQAQAEKLTLLVAKNKTGYFGVVLNKPGQPKPYQARVWRGGKQVYLGIFATAEEAALCVARSPEGQAAAKKPAAAAAALTSEEAREYLSLSVPNLLTTLKHQCVQPEKQEQLDQMLQRYMQNELGKEQVRSSIAALLYVDEACATLFIWSLTRLPRPSPLFPFTVEGRAPFSGGTRGATVRSASNGAGDR